MQAKFNNDGSILSMSFATAPAASQNEDHFKIGQN
jgi:hypothetical protein